MLSSKSILSVALVLLSSAGLAMSTGEPPATQPVNQQPNSKPAPAKETAKTRGQLLYETHCIACHESGLHVRERRKARNIAEINQWVGRWVGYQKLNWGIEDIQEVANYLNRQFYQYKE